VKRRSSVTSLSTSDAEIEDLRVRLREAEDTLRAIRHGEIDALIVDTKDGQKTFTLSGADQIYRVLIDSMSEGALVLTPDGTINYANARFAELVERPLASLVGTSVKQLILPEEQLNFATLLREAQLRHSGAEFLLIGGQQGSISVFISVSMVDTCAGPVACLVISDLREYKKNALFEALRESAAQFRLLADSMPQIAWSAGPDGGFDYHNKRLSEFVGESELHNISLTDYLHPSESGPFDEAWKDSLQYEKPFQMEHRLRLPSGGYRWHLTRAAPLKDSLGKVAKWFGTSTDIQNQKTLQDALSQQTEELLRSNTELARFAYVASHDLKEPLRVVTSYAQLLRKKYQNCDAETDKYVGFVVKGVNHMYALIEDVLSYSRIGATPDNLRKTDVNKVVSSAIANLEISISESNAEIVNMGIFPTLVADTSQILQVFQNLIGNAIKYRTSDKPPKINVRAVHSENRWIFSVSDNGMGIERDYFDKIFLVFQRLNPTNQQCTGTGIGLAVCKKIVERHGGSIWVESEFGLGSTFLFSIPDDIQSGASLAQ